MEPSHKNTNEAPEEAQIESLLKRFKPQPTARFHQRMRVAPWNLAGLTESRKLSRKWIWGLAAVLVGLIIGVTIFIPSVNAIARQIVNSFISAPTNQIEVQVTPSSPGELLNFNDASLYTLTLAEAQELSGFKVKQISPIPGGLSFVGARYDPSYSAVTLFYRGDAYSLFLTQRLLGKGQDVFSIGQNAQVILVKIGDIQGEYVEGGWKVISTQPPANLQTEQSPVSIIATWDNSLPQSTLRWQSTATSYELRVVGEGRASQSDLIMWANGLK